MLSRT